MSAPLPSVRLLSGSKVELPAHGQDATAISDIKSLREAVAESLDTSEASLQLVANGTVLPAEGPIPSDIAELQVVLLRPQLAVLGCQTPITEAKVCVWDLQRQSITAHIDTGYEDDVYAMSADFVAFLAAFGLSSGMLKLYSLKSGALLRERAAHGSKVFAVAMNVASGMVVTGGADWSVRIWQMPSEASSSAGFSWVYEYHAHQSPVCKVCFDAGRLGSEAFLVVSASCDTTLAVLEGDMGESHPDASAQPVVVAKGTLKGHTMAVYDVCASRELQLAVSAAGDRCVRVWDLKDMVCLRILRSAMQAGRFCHLAVDFEGGLVVACDARNDVHQWDLHSSELLSYIGIISMGESLQATEPPVPACMSVNFLRKQAAVGMNSGLLLRLDLQQRRTRSVQQVAGDTLRTATEMRPTYNILGDDDPEEDLWSVLAVDMDVCEGDPENEEAIEHAEAG